MRRHTLPTLLLLLAAACAAPGCATMYVGRNAAFAHDRSSDIVLVRGAVIDGSTLFVDVSMRAQDGRGTRQATLRLPLPDLSGELRLQETSGRGLLRSWSLIDEHTAVARLSRRAVRSSGEFPERAAPLPLRRTGLDEFRAAAGTAPAVAGVEVHLVSTTAPAATLLGVVLPHPVWVGQGRLLISGVDEEEPKGASYLAWGGALVLDVVATQFVLATVYCLLGGCY